MPRYLFSNDQRISVLADRIQWVADYVLSGKKLKDIPDKSDNNNAATLEFTITYTQILKILKLR